MLSRMAGPGVVTVLWVSEESVITGASGVRPRRTTIDELAASVSASLSRGGVVAVVDTDDAAHRALASGADEVIRGERLDATTLELVVERAKLRATVRAMPHVARTGLDDAAALELLAASIGSHLHGQLAAAAFSCDVLRAAMGPVAGLADTFAQTAAQQDALPDRERARIVALRATAPTSQALHATVDGLTVALRDAARVVQQACSFLADDSEDDAIDLVEAVRDLAGLVAVVVDRDAELRVELPSAVCVVRFPRWQLAQTFAALISNALHAITARGGRGVITLRVIATPDAALLEVIDDGVGMTLDVQERAFEPYFSTRSPAGAGLGLTVVAERVRHADGDVVLESVPGRGTKAQIFLPLAAPILVRSPRSAAN